MTAVYNKKGKTTGYKNSIVEITTSGKITAIGSGKTVITGKDTNNRTVTLTVTVTTVLTKEATYITKGKTETIKFPKVTNRKADWWKSSNTGVASVVGSGKKMNGKVTANAYGSSDISCYYNGFTFETTAFVEDPVIEFAGGIYTDNKGKVNMSVGERRQFKLNNVYQTLNYTSSRPKVAFVDENGYVYARSKGKATISAKVNGKTYKITITVK